MYLPVCLSGLPQPRWQPRSCGGPAASWQQDRLPPALSLGDSGQGAARPPVGSVTPSIRMCCTTPEVFTQGTHVKTEQK